MPNPVGAPVQEPPLAVVWASALPISLAGSKLRFGDIPEADRPRFSRPDPFYVIAVAGLPPPDVASDPHALAKKASIIVPGRAALTATDSDYRHIGNEDVYFFRFVRAALPIAASDKDVEFRLHFGKTEIKTKFELQDMMYKGQLAL
jgi:hypothetical protein